MKLSTLMIGLGVLGAAGSAVSIPLYQRAQAKARRANAFATIDALRQIANAQTLFREGDKDGDGVLAYAPDLESLVRTRTLDPEIGDGVYRGYRIVIRHHDETPGSDQFVWTATATPLEPGVTGEDSFGVNMAGLVFYGREPITFSAEGSSIAASICNCSPP